MQQLVDVQIEVVQEDQSASMVPFLAWPPLQSLAVKKKHFFVQILGGEKLLKFVEKCR